MRPEARTASCRGRRLAENDVHAKESETWWTVLILDIEWVGSVSQSRRAALDEGPGHSGVLGVGFEGRLWCGSGCTGGD